MVNRKVKLFLTYVYLTFILFFIYLFFYQRYYSGTLLEPLFFITTLLICSNISLIGERWKGILTSINIPLLMPSMVILDPLWVAVIAMVGTIKVYQIKKDFRWYQFLFNRFMLFIAAGAGAVVFRLCSNFFNTNPFNVFSFLFAALAYFLINTGMVFQVVRLANRGKKDTSLFLHYIQLSKNLLTSYFLGLIFYYSYIAVGRVFFVLVIVLIYVLKDLLFSRIQQLDSFTQVVESFLKVIDSKDHYTQGHCERVARYTGILCREFGLSSGKTERIVNMAKIHDIGKIYVKDQILKSSSVLNKDEYEEMNKHSQYGYQLLKDINLLRRDLEIILYHHEWYNGDGYPDGLKGERIPLGARILSICDAFDVMVTGRDYKPPKDRERIMEEFKEYAGKQFDPELARMMITLIRSGKFRESFKEKTG